MKKIMIMLALAGLSCTAAQAQTKTSTNNTCNTTTKHMKAKTVAHHVTMNNHRGRVTAGKAAAYQVCRNEGGYYTCCVYKNNTRLRY
jgi:hypothetical protein